MPSLSQRYRAPPVDLGASPVESGRWSVPLRPLARLPAPTWPRLRARGASRCYRPVKFRCHRGGAAGRRDGCHTSTVYLANHKGRIDQAFPCPNRPSNIRSIVGLAGRDSREGDSIQGRFLKKSVTLGLTATEKSWPKTAHRFQRQISDDPAKRVVISENGDVRPSPPSCPSDTRARR